jgi:hypothetical protein
LTDSEVAVGLVATVSSGAWLLPQLIFANMLTNKRRKKPYAILGSGLGRPLFLLYAVALALGLHNHPLLALLLLYGVLAIYNGGEALANVAWYDVLGKAIPETRRGRLLGSAELVSGLLSVGSGVLVAVLLGTGGLSFPHNYAVLLAMTGAFLLLSLFSFSLVIEPDETVEEEQPAWTDFLSQLINTFRLDRAFARLMVIRLVAGAGGLASSFYFLFVTQELGLPRATAGLFTIAQVVGRVAASAGLGALSERAGSQRVIQVATAISVTVPLLGLALILADVQSSTVITAICIWIFMVIGASISVLMLGFSNYALDLAPAGQRPTYIGLFNTIGGVLIVLPTLGGWLLRTTSYGVLFALTTTLLIVAHGLSWSLPSVRVTATADQTT